MHEQNVTEWSPPEHDGIRQRTSDATNRRIDRTTRGALTESAGSREKIAQRRAELDREWNVDRALMLNFAVLGSITASMAMRNLVRRGSFGGWGVLFWAQLSFLAYHATRRWCPPLPLFRRLGFRSEREICAERTALALQDAELDRIASSQE